MTSEPVRPWYEIDTIDTIDTPALAVYPERVRENIRALLGMVKQPSLLRPHAKTHKSIDAARMLIEEGIAKFKCATIAEAEMLGLAGASDVLIAYQPVGPKAARVYELMKRFPSTHYSSVIDNEATARAISCVFEGHHAVLDVSIDLNVGMNRTGIAPESAAALYRACATLPGIRITGLHVYDGHIQHSDLATRRAEFDQAFAPVDRLMKELNASAAHPLVLAAGGSPTFPFLAERGDVECSPGTFIYWDKSYATQLSDQPFKPAMLVLSRVISRPAPGMLCLDAGYKAVCCEKDLQHRLSFLSAPEAVVVSQSEEHVVIAGADTDRFAVGDVLYAVPYHICPTCAMYERANVILGHRAEGEWMISARDRKITC